MLADLIASGVVPVVRLSEVFREAAQSRIIQAAHRINRGEMPEGTPSGQNGAFYIVPVDGPETAAERVVALVAQRIPERFGFDPVQDIQVLCPMNRGGAGARALGLAMPRDLSITGFDDLDFAAYAEPPLTTVRVPAAEMGRRAAEHLIAVASGTPAPAGTVLEAPVMLRGSTASPPSEGRAVRRRPHRAHPASGPRQAAESPR